MVQLSRGRSRRQICARVTIGDGAQGVPEATCAKKRTRSPSGRASILKKAVRQSPVIPAPKLRRLPV